MSVDREIIFQQYIPGYGEVSVEDSVYQGEIVRLLMVNGAMQSSTYLDPARHAQLIFGYMNEFDWAQRLRPEAKRTLLIGGGAMSYPKHFVETFPGRQIDVVELCPEMVDLAKRYFFYEEVMARKSESSPEPRIFITDGDAYLSETQETYDVILSDVYIGFKWHRKAAAQKNCNLVKSRLNEGGIYALNVVTAQKGPYGLRGYWLMKHLRNCFKHTLLIPCQAENDFFYPQNCLIFATDGELAI